MANKADVVKKRLKFRRRLKKKGRKHRRKKADDKKTFREMGDIYIVKSSVRKGQLTGSEQRMINDFGEIHHVNKANDKERSSDEIESKILDRNPESDSSRLDMILHALRNSNKSNESKKDYKEESKDQMLVTQKASDKKKKSKKYPLDHKKSPLSILPNDPVKNVFKLNSRRSSD